MRLARRNPPPTGLLLFIPLPASSASALVLRGEPRASLYASNITDTTEPGRGAWLLHSRKSWKGVTLWTSSTHPKCCCLGGGEFHSSSPACLQFWHLDGGNHHGLNSIKPSMPPPPPMPSPPPIPSLSVSAAAGEVEHRGFCFFCLHPLLLMHPLRPEDRCMLKHRQLCSVWCLFWKPNLFSLHHLHQGCQT